MHVLVAPGRFDARPGDGPGPAASAVRGVAGPSVAAGADPWPVLTADEAVAALTAGWLEAAPGDTLLPLPLSDGGAGLVDAVRAARGGELLPVTTTDAHGAVVPGAVLVVPEPGGGRTAYVDGALALGAGDPGAVPPGATTSAGLGTLLAAALDTGAGRVVVGLGGRRTVAHDAGAGLLAALGAAPAAAARGLDGAAGLAAADLGEVGALRAALRGRDLVVLHAHDLPLLGLGGVSADLAEAGRVDADAAQDVERSVAGFVRAAGEAAALTGDGGRRDLLGGGVAGAPAGPGARAPGSRAALVPGSGAGGGAAFALGLLGARLVDGASWVADAVDLPGRAAEVDLVLTGTSVLDATALEHGVVGVAAHAALPLGVPAIAVAAHLRTGRRDWGAAGLAAGFGVVEAPGDEDAWRRDPSAALRARVPRIARTWSR
ncbi:glycerate kinase [Cellulomonas sp. PS-H5]|uniref:glycerate kinase n=1 Tax=Cellulomonas sp. PS-H5 TaxID=2820400 RepID=UPI001C4EFDDA|nr:glycerate kinase [Cellulomonas sp. PS-H5]MBW0254154.1 glycerate kinase [Cellulomonas sp. PS-H5]